jgi:hypothetical protein
MIQTFIFVYQVKHGGASLASCSWADGDHVQPSADWLAAISWSECESRDQASADMLH